MTTDERPERTQDESGHTKRRNHPLISLCSLCVWLFFGKEWGLGVKEWGMRVLEARYERKMIMLGVVLVVASALLFWVVWKSMEPSETLYFEAQQRETATKVAIVPAAAAVLCFVLGYVSFRARLIAGGIVLLGLAAVYATFLVAKKGVGEAEAAMYSVVIAVAGLSGLACTTLGMVRILATSKGALP